MRVIPSTIGPGHRDYDGLDKIRTAILAKVGGADRLREVFPSLVRSAIDFVIDPVTTGRTRFEHLDNVEKTFIGLKTEHFIRDLLDVPKGIRDLEIDGMDVDIKNTIGNTWMIPPETYRNEDPVLVAASEDATHRCWLGLLMARAEYLSAPNRDMKRGVRSTAFPHIMWLVEAAPYPRSPWRPIDMSRFRELRKIAGGTNRVCAFFRENLREPVHRSVVQALLFDQKDYMKRLRGNGGARDILRTEGIALLSGLYDGDLIKELGLPYTAPDEMIAAAPRNAREEDRMRLKRVID